MSIKSSIKAVSHWPLLRYFAHLLAVCERSNCVKAAVRSLIAHEGHIDALIRRLIEQHNVPLHVAYRVASWSTARHFGLNHLGLLAPGKQADIVLLSDARKVTVQQVLVKGEPIDAQTLQAEESARLAQSAPPYGNTIARQPVSASDFALQAI